MSSPRLKHCRSCWRFFGSGDITNIDGDEAAAAAYSVGGRRDKIASSIINTLKTNPKLFRLTISALAKLVNNLRSIYRNAGSNSFLASGGNKNNCGRDSVIHEVGLIKQSVVNNSL